MCSCTSEKICSSKVHTVQHQHDAGLPNVARPKQLGSIIAQDDTTLCREPGSRRDEKLRPKGGNTSFQGRNEGSIVCMSPADVK